jgi:hypothetical protein
MKRGYMWLVGGMGMVGMFIMDIDPFPVLIALVICTIIR